MSGVIYFTSGKSLEITETERLAIAPKLLSGGVRLYRTGAGHLIPLNSNTMEMIEYIPEVIKEEPPKPKIEKEITSNFEIKEKEKRTPEQRYQDAHDELMAKSSCTHENQTLYVQQTAKGERFFPVCDFCGKRERYISEKKVVAGEYEEWSENDISNAKAWIEE